MASVYQINKGVSKPITFKGLKAQYIAYLAIGLVSLLITFAVLYVLGASLFVILPLIFILGATLFLTVTRLSHRFGQHGLSKFLARGRLPLCLKFRSRRLFTNLKNNIP
jgi:Flp pilus assembly protein TadB